MSGPALTPPGMTPPAEGMAPPTPQVSGPGGIYRQQRTVKEYPEIVTDEVLMQYLGYIPPSIHILDYGLSGAGKSRFARTMPTPWLILGWDPYDNMRSYTAGLVTQDGVVPWGQGYPLEYTDCWTPEGVYCGRIEHYAEPNPDLPTAYGLFKQRAGYLSPAHVQQTYGFTPRTVVWDSLSYSTNAAVLYHMRVQESNSAFKMSGHAKTEMVKDIMSRLAWMRCNVVVTAHLAKPTEREEYNTGLVRGIEAVGTLGSELPSGFGEVYRSFVLDRPGQNAEQWLQTKGDTLYAAKSIARVPNPCQPHYLALWEK